MKSKMYVFNQKSKNLKIEINITFFQKHYFTNNYNEMFSKKLYLFEITSTNMDEFV